MKKGEESKKAMADTSAPVYALDKNDPNYNSEDEPYKLKATQAFPRTDVIDQYKNKVAQLVEVRAAVVCRLNTSG